MEILTSRELMLKDLEQTIHLALKETISTKKEELLSLPDISLLVRNNINSLQHRYQILLQAIEQLSPIQVMRRGYAVMKNSDSELVTSIRQVSEGETITSYLVDGTVHSVVNSIDKGDTLGKK